MHDFRAYIFAKQPPQRGLSAIAELLVTSIGIQQYGRSVRKNASFLLQMAIIWHIDITKFNLNTYEHIHDTITTLSKMWNKCYFAVFFAKFSLIVIALLQQAIVRTFHPAHLLC